MERTWPSSTTTYYYSKVLGFRVYSDRRITRARVCVWSFSDELASKRAAVESELNRRRCAEAVAEATPDFVCPISHPLMSDAVVASEGNSYERREIEKWFAEGHESSPLTAAGMPSRSLFPNLNLKKMIAMAMEQETAGIADRTQKRRE